MALAAFVVSPDAIAAKPFVYMSADDNTAINGYDPVAYFTDGKPRRGKNTLYHYHNGAKWLFSNSEHLALFKDNPEQFTPQFGGYCAFSVAQGLVLHSKPQHWEIYNGKLYLNRNASIHELWLDRHDILSERADQNWPAVLEGEVIPAFRQQLIDADRKLKNDASRHGKDSQ